MESAALSVSGRSPAIFPAELKLSGAPARRFPAALSASAAESCLKLTMNVPPVVSSGKGDREVDAEVQKGNRRWVHFVGVGGCGLSALAKLSAKRGFEVSGSDLVRSSYMEGLSLEGAQLCIGHSASNIQRDNGLTYPDSIVVSSAICPNNAEVLHAKSVGIPVYKRDYWLGKLTENHRLIAVSGSHGKSTTAAMLSYVLKAMGDDITAVIGANVPQFQEGNIIAGNGQNFVLEADEYDGCFLGLSPYIAVVTNLDWEHVDQFPDKEAVETSFRRFLKQIKTGGHLILCGDSPGACSLLDSVEASIGSDKSIGVNPVSRSTNRYRITTYGSSSMNEWSASFIHPNSKGGSNYTLFYKGLPIADICLKIPGVHNVLNSLSVIATIVALFGNQINHFDLINSTKIHLRNFAGVSRRFEKVGSICGCHIYDDYAHHPTEIHAVLKAARDMFPYKIITVVFQPHTYSRLAALIDDFAAALERADRVIVTAVYAARENNVWGVSGRDLASRLSGVESEYIPCLENVVDKLVCEISEEPHQEILVLTLGAGDVTTIGPKLLSQLKSVKSNSFELLQK